jgi:hypothetical protein
MRICGGIVFDSAFTRPSQVAKSATFGEAATSIVPVSGSTGCAESSFQFAVARKGEGKPVSSSHT